MPKTKDNDDQLVQLLARGELADRQIAGRLGISASQVTRIARGEKRPELQPKILAAMRQTLKEAWKNGGRLDSDSDSGDPAPTATAHAPFDRHLAVELIASGQLTLSQIADRLGIHKTAAWRIATGRSHAELQPLIREAQQHYRDRARRIGTKWCAQIVTKQIQVGLKDNGWVGLRARQDLLDRFLGPEEDGVESEVPPAERDFGPGIEDLPEPLLSQVIEALGGPAADEAEDEYVYWNDPSTWKPVGAAAETPNIAKPPDETAPAQETAAALQDDVASRRTSGPSAEQEQKNDAATAEDAEYAEGHNGCTFKGRLPQSRCPPKSRRDFRPDCVGTPASGSGPSAEPRNKQRRRRQSRNNQRRRRQRREVDSFIR